MEVHLLEVILIFYINNPFKKGKNNKNTISDFKTSMKLTERFDLFDDIPYKDRNYKEIAMKQTL